MKLKKIFQIEKRWKNSILTILIGNGLLLGMLATGVISLRDETVTNIPRSSYAEMAREETLSLKLENGEEIPMIIQVDERIYSDEEIEAFFQEAREKLPKVILGENLSLDAVWTDLNFITQLENNPVSIEWQTSDGEFLTAMGERTEKELDGEEKKSLTITACLSCQEQEDILEMPISLVEKSKNAEEAFLEKVQKEVTKRQEESRTEETFMLPEEVDGSSLIWLKKNQMSIGGIVFLIFVLGGVVYWKEEKNRERQEEKRKQQMMLDYPEVVSKLTLLLGAGMSLQRAWERMVKEYLAKKKEQRYVYEEMARTSRETANGIPWNIALDHFGKRSKLSAYMKFATLLAQNAKRGNRGLAESLQKEAEEAFEERKAMARKLGEEASTKMLAPMFLMLAMVLVVIMVPAFLSFSF